MLAVARRRQPMMAYNRLHPILMRNSNIFKKNLRFDKAAINDLVQITDPYLAEPNPNGLTLTKEDQVLLFISTLSTNGFQSLVCDRFGCSQQTVSNIFERVLQGLTDPLVVSRFIQFPVDDARWRRRTAADFSRIAGLRNVVGAVDGTFIPIQNPPNSNNRFRCRKQYPALNACFIVDSWGRILYCNPRFPGSTHDSFVLEHSTARRAINALTCPQGYALLGDSAYRNDARLMTPHPHPTTRQEKRFNKMHKRTRVIVEQVYGMMKRRFPILSGKIRYDVDKAARIVLAVAVLWNYGLDRGHGAQRGRGPIDLRHPMPASSRNVRAVVIASL